MLNINNNGWVMAGWVMAFIVSHCIKIIFCFVNKVQHALDVRNLIYPII